MPTKSTIIVGLTCLLMVGCTFRSSQLDAMLNLLNREEISTEHLWLLQLPNAEPMRLLVVAEQHPEVTFFAVDSDLQINFNGWNVTLAQAWPERDTTVALSIEDNIVTHQLEDNSEITTRCSAWNEVRSGNLEQECASQDGPSWRYTNRIDLDSQGRITHLSFGLWPGLSQLELNWLPSVDPDASVNI